MQKFVLFTTGCPKCKILEKKLTDKKVEFEICNDVSKIAELGITSVPVLQTPDGMLDYFKAVKYVNQL